MEALWTLPELVAEVGARIAALPAPKNGQVRAVPDDRTIRYYATIGLLARPAAMRGRTALYGRRHVAQVVAIKRLQSLGRTLAEILALWPTLDDATLARMSGVELPVAAPAPVRAAFWKGPVAGAAPAPPTARPATAPARGSTELRIELAPNVIVAIALPGDRAIISPADVRALRAAAAPLIAELASRQLASQPSGDEP